MDMDVDQARRDDQPRRVADWPFAALDDFAVSDVEVCDFVAAIYRIDDATPADNRRAHAGSALILRASEAFCLGVCQPSKAASQNATRIAENPRATRMRSPRIDR